MAKERTGVDTLTIESRDRAGTTAAHALRRAGKVPGVLYGHGAPSPIAIEAKALEALLMGGGKSHILDATIDGKHDSVLLRVVQRDPVNHKPIHADFQRVSKGEAITASLPIVTTGIAAGVKDSGGVLDFVTRAIDVKGPADKLPDNITVDVSGLQLHGHITVGDLALPAGFTCLTPHETMVVTVEASKTAQQAEAIATPPPAVVEEPAPAAGDVPAP